MAKRRDVETTETEGGFGTGLRAKVRQGQEGAWPEAAPPAREPQPAPPAGQVLDAFQADISALQNEVEAARHELQVALEREHELRRSLADAQERELRADASVAERVHELDERAGVLSEREAELDGRERAAAEAMATLEEERERVLGLQEELAAQRVYADEREQALDAKLRELKDAER